MIEFDKIKVGDEFVSWGDRLKVTKIIADKKQVECIDEDGLTWYADEFYLSGCDMVNDKH